MMKRAAIYARVSTTNGQTPSNQIGRLREVAEKAGWEIVEEFVDRGISGAKRGYIIQMTNPKAALAWIAIISLGLTQDAPIWVGFVIVLGTFILSIVIHTLYAVAFSTPIMVRIYSKARRYIQATLGTFFAFAGLKLLTSRS